MKEVIEQILPLWGIEAGEVLQIYSSAWEVNHSYIIKVYKDRKQLERNIIILTILAGCNVPVAEIVPTKAGEKYAEYENFFYLMSKKLEGNHISDIKHIKMAREMGRAIAQLHGAFRKCEKEVEFWDNSLLEEMKGWIYEKLNDNQWYPVSQKEYAKSVEQLEKVYDSLPKQLIHRDVHYGNFLFSKGRLSGYLDFDLSQRNIRIFDICYFLTGLLAEETEAPFTKEEWVESVRAVVDGYESVSKLLPEEKSAIPCVMECIEILFAAYYAGMKDTESAEGAYQILGFIQSCGNSMI